MAFNRQSNMVDPSHFAMVPRSDVPRSVFRSEHGHKTTFNAQDLVPVYCQEILPGDSFQVKMTAFTRLATLLFPLMDSLELCSFFFFVPNRLTWANWQRFMGEQIEPGASTSFTVPQVVHSAAPPSFSTYDYFGLPVAISGVSGYSHNALPFRAYNLIWNQWFRDENLQGTAIRRTDDGPDLVSDYTTLRGRAKRHDYFTSALPFAQKGPSATIPIQGTAPVTGIGVLNANSVSSPLAFIETSGATPTYPTYVSVDTSGFTPISNQLAVRMSATQPQVFADLSQATATTINALRQSFQIQKLLERDARGGTRYTEILRAHFGVTSPDARLQRAEYLGGGCTPIVVNPVAQTSVTAATPQGNLAGVGHGVAQHGFSKSFVEHGYVIGLVSVRANLSYQQGLQRMWSRSTRYDFYWPAFAHLGEQSILNKEIRLVGGGAAADNEVFGYQERWAEYRYEQSKITGKFRSGVTGTLDAWHLAESFATTPALNSTFIAAAPPMSRVYAAGASSANQQFLFDSLFETKMTRPMPIYSVPGFVDRF